MKKVKEESLASFRYRMMTRGYMNKKELAQFMDCGERTANQAWKRMMQDAQIEGVERLNNGKYILARRAITFLGLSEKRITDAYEREQMFHVGTLDEDAGPELIGNKGSVSDLVIRG